MGGNYPEGVTGNEPHFGGGFDDACVRCLEAADEEVKVLGNIPEGVIPCAGEYICVDCLKEEIEENTGLLFETLVAFLTKEKK